MTETYAVETPDGFQASDWGDDVHATATRQFTAADQASVFAQAREWIAGHKVYVLDLAWRHFDNEDEPYMLTVYFTFDDSQLD